MAILDSRRLISYCRWDIEFGKERQVSLLGVLLIQLPRGSILMQSFLRFGGQGDRRESNISREGRDIVYALFDAMFMLSYRPYLCN